MYFGPFLLTPSWPFAWKFHLFWKYLTGKRQMFEIRWQLFIFLLSFSGRITEFWSSSGGFGCIDWTCLHKQAQFDWRQYGHHWPTFEDCFQVWYHQPEARAVLPYQINIIPFQCSWVLQVCIWEWSMSKGCSIDKSIHFEEIQIFLILLSIDNSMAHITFYALSRPKLKFGGYISVTSVVEVCQWDSKGSMYTGSSHNAIFGTGKKSH